MSDSGREANETTQCEVCDEMTDYPKLTADSHPVGPNQWVCGDCDE
jgi:heterodisulfide reductase subunit A-like polyferredoxin